MSHVTRIHKNLTRKEQETVLHSFELKLQEKENYIVGTKVETAPDSLFRAHKGSARPHFTFWTHCAMSPGDILTLLPPGIEVTIKWQCQTFLGINIRFDIRVDGFGGDILEDSPVMLVDFLSEGETS